MGADYEDISAFTTNAGAANESAISANGWAPEIFFGEQHLPGILGDGTDQSLVLSLGQFNPAQNTERLYRRVSLMLYRSDCDDWTPPKIDSVHASPALATRVSVQDINLAVQIEDGNEIYKVHDKRYSNIPKLTYLLPSSGSTVTTTPPSSSSAVSMAAATAAPPLTPTKRPAL